MPVVACYVELLARLGRGVIMEVHFSMCKFVLLLLLALELGTGSLPCCPLTEWFVAALSPTCDLGCC